LAVWVTAQAPFSQHIRLAFLMERAIFFSSKNCSPSHYGSRPPAFSSALSLEQGLGTSAAMASGHGSNEMSSGLLI